MRRWLRPRRCYVLAVLFPLVSLLGACGPGGDRGARSPPAPARDWMAECATQHAGRLEPCLWAEGLPADHRTRCAAEALGRWWCEGADVEHVERPDMTHAATVRQVSTDCGVDLRALSAGVWRWQVIEQLDEVKMETWRAGGRQ